MTGLWILLGIILFVLLLLLIPVHINIEYDGEARVWVRYLFIKYSIYPPAPKKEKKKPEKKKKKPEEEKEEKPKKENPAITFVKEHGIDAVIEILRGIVTIIKDSLGTTSRHLIISKLVINAIIVGKDSADTAMKYGYACSVIYPMIGFLDTNARLRRHSEDISAGFLFNKTIVEFVFHSHIRPYWLVGIGVSAVAKLLASLVRAAKMKS